VMLGGRHAGFGVTSREVSSLNWPAGSRRFPTQPNKRRSHGQENFGQLARATPRSPPPSTQKDGGRSEVPDGWRRVCNRFCEPPIAWQ
jgi:hypothetical protein